MHDVWLPPQQIAEFRVERRLGSGATSDVWLARDTVLDRVVALKIASSAATSETRARFRVEARAVAKMHHPNLLAIHHVGDVDDRPFLVTEFLSGKSLDEIARPVPPERVVTIGIDLARGLSAAHRAGVLHRDIKPANAFLCDDGVAKVLDFGLAKLNDSSLALTVTSSSNVELRSSPGRPPPASGPADSGSPVSALDATEVAMTYSGGLAGTPLYMAPETWRGENATPLTDVFSLGALLYELLTGQPPFSAPSLTELRAKILAGDAGDLAARVPTAPAALVEVVLRCLRVVPDERPAADEVCDALSRVLSARASLLAEALDDPRDNPYRGLLTFGPEHRALFFGREAEAATIIAELRASPFVLVVGASGAGKSSLVRAGVVPRVEKGALAAGTEWRTIFVVPGGMPAEGLAQAAAPVLGVSESELSGELARSATWLADELRAAGTRVLLVIDQLEEIWTLAPAPERERFFEVVAAITRSAPLARVVATLRSDFLGRIEDMGELQAQALGALVVLRPMATEGLRRAIVEPAQRRGVTIEPALVDELVKWSEGGSLPLLEFCLGALYAKRRAGATAIGLADLETLGGVEGALATHADGAIARLPTAQRREARRLLLALVTVERTRWRREERDLVSAGGGGGGDTPDASASRDALAALVDARLVVASAGENGAAYEVAHEALLSGWPALRGWLDEEAMAREAAERVRRAAVEWERVGQSDEALLGERQLGELEGRSFDGVSGVFVAASRAALRGARRRRTALLVAGPVGALLLVAAIAGGVRVGDRTQARAFVAARLAEAGPATAAAKDLDAQVQATRAAAFARFAAGDTPGGEARWQGALTLARREADAFAAASSPLGLALARDPLDPDARARAAGLAYSWLLAAERDREPAVARDLVARLAQLDDDGSRRARLAAPAHLRVTVAPPEARVVLRAVSVDPNGRRVEDEGRSIHTGAALELAAGSYVLDASAPGRSAARYPVLLGRGADERVEITLPSAAAVPPGFVVVPGGVSLVGADDAEATRVLLNAEPEHAMHVEAFLIAEHEVTYAEYLDFLATLPPAEQVARRPYARDLDFGRDPDGAPVVTIGGARVRRGDPLCRPKRASRRCQDWTRFPVAGVSWQDAKAYAAWLATEHVPGARLCSELEWERAARGADGRRFPWGDVIHPGDANYDATYAGEEDQMGVDEVGSFPADRSVFGALDLAGNVAEWVGEHDLVLRGGRWQDTDGHARSAHRIVPADGRAAFIGLRVCATAPRPP